MLGFDSEMAAAAAALGVGDEALPPCIAVPGNHDVYVARAERRGAFEAAFAGWQQGQRVGKAIYPFARKVGHVWLIARQLGARRTSGCGTRAGKVGEKQLDRLRELVPRPRRRTADRRQPLPDPDPQAHPRTAVPPAPRLGPRPRRGRRVRRQPVAARPQAQRGTSCPPARTCRSPRSAPAAPRRRRSGATTST